MYLITQGSGLFSCSDDAFVLFPGGLHWTQLVGGARLRAWRIVWDWFIGLVFKWHVSLLPVSHGAEFRDMSIFNGRRKWDWKMWLIGILTYLYLLPKSMLKLVLLGTQDGTVFSYGPFKERIEFKWDCKGNTNPGYLVFWHEGRLRHTRWHQDLPRHKGTNTGRGRKRVTPWSWMYSFGDMRK